VVIALLLQARSLGSTLARDMYFGFLFCIVFSLLFTTSAQVGGCCSGFLIISWIAFFSLLPQAQLVKVCVSFAQHYGSIPISLKLFFPNFEAQILIYKQ